MVTADTDTTGRWTDVDWARSHRIIRTVYPPVSLFEDIADPADWDLIASAEAKTNPRVRDQIGNLTLVPPHRRPSGGSPGVSLVMGAFTHASSDRPSRFSDGTFGTWYCGSNTEVALAETIFHFENFMGATDEPAADADYRELVSGAFGHFRDLRAGDRADCLHPDDYRPGQALGRALRGRDADGIVYPSVRWPDGEALALFFPDRIRPPVTQASHFRYHWNGRHCDRVFVHGEQAWAPWPSARSPVSA